MSHGSQLMYSFDPTQFNTASGGGDFITESGKYPVVIVGVTLQPTRNNAANIMAVIDMQITDGPLKGKKFVDRLNLIHSSVDTKRIAHEQLTSYATAIGQSAAFQELTVLANRPFQVFVTATEKESQNDPNKKVWDNRVTGWFYANGADVVQGNFGGQPQQTQQFASQGQPQPQNSYGQPQPQVAPPAAPAPMQPQPQVMQPQVQQAQAPVTTQATFQQPVQQQQPQVQQPVQVQQPQANFAPPVQQAQPQFAPPQFAPPPQQ